MPPAAVVSVMRLRFVQVFAIVVSILVGMYAGSALTLRYYLPIYEAPLIAMNSMFISAMDDCLDRKDDACFRRAFGFLINSEKARAEAVLDYGLSVKAEAEVEEHFSRLAELREKYDPDA